MRRAVLSVLSILVLPCVAVAHEWSAEQQEVWTVIQAQWAATMEEDASWPDRFLHDDFLGWANDTPAPRGNSSEGKWSRYGMETATTLVQELYPIGIIVRGNTAVAHYFYSTASENRKGDRETTHGRFTDVLVKEGDSWRFIAWHGGADPDNDG